MVSMLYDVICSRSFYFVLVKNEESRLNIFSIFFFHLFFFDLFSFILFLELELGLE